MADLNKIIDELSTLTVVEAAELSKQLEEKWGVTAAAPVAAAPAVATVLRCSPRIGSGAISWRAPRGTACCVPATWLCRASLMWCVQRGSSRARGTRRQGRGREARRRCGRTLRLLSSACRECTAPLRAVIGVPLWYLCTASPMSACVWVWPCSALFTPLCTGTNATAGTQQQQQP